MLGFEPIEKTDRRYKDGRPHEAYEAEAVGQGVLSSVVTNLLDGLLPEPLEDLHERERAEREETLARLA